MTSWDTSKDNYTFNYDRILFGGYTMIKNEKGKDEMNITFPKGSYPKGAEKGGCGFYSNPKKIFPKNSITFEYKVFFDKNFDFLKGGKLPGLSGGEKSNGGNKSEDGFSFRIMWRKDGVGEIYIYVPKNQHSDYPKITYVREKYGDSIGKGTFKFEKGKWHTISQYIKLNDVGKFNGIIKLKIDGKTCIDYDKMNFRDNKDVTIDNIFFNTFFGGSDSSWASSLDTWAKFKDFKLY